MEAKRKRLIVRDVDRCVGCQSCMFACSRRLGKGGIAGSSIHVRSVGGVERGFILVVCRACWEPPCADVCPVEALKVREGGGIVLERDRCIGCELCRDTCPIGAVFWDDEINKPMICVQCGYCVDFCPHEVIGMEEVNA